MACKSCRFRKIKCDRGHPVCENCKLRGAKCTYEGERPKRRWTEDDSRRNSKREWVWFSKNAGNQPVFEEIEGISPIQPQTMPSSTDDAQNPGPSDPHLDFLQTRTHDAPDISPRSVAPVLRPEPFTLIDSLLLGDGSHAPQDTSPALWARMSNGDEYTGPSSGISAISDTGLKWIREHVPNSDSLCRVIQEIRNGILNHLRQPKFMPPPLQLSLGAQSDFVALDHSKIMEYVDAYFSSVQIIFPILDKPTFLEQLAQFGSGPSNTTHSWNALLNAVLASGCRASLSDETPEAFQQSGCKAWTFFQKALSYESRIFHDSADLLAAQAFAVMTVFAQGLSSPQRLEYTLCSTAARLAQSLALHCYAPGEWNITERERLERDRVFWVIFCLDKTISLRCGRPAIIQDAEVSCPFPRNIPIKSEDWASGENPDSVQTLDFFLCFARFARICGRITQDLYSAAALYLPSTELQGKAKDILEQMDSWCTMIPADIKPGKPIGRLCDTSRLSRTQIVVLHSSYYYALCAVYRRFSPMFNRDRNEVSLPPSTHPTHIEAARSVALLTKHLDVESVTPAWLVFYYPFTALTTIFVHVLSHPLEPSTQKDIPLMDTIVGFFGRLEYVTSGGAAFTNTAEFTRQARRFIDQHSITASSNSRSTLEGSVSGPKDTSFQNAIDENSLLDASEDVTFISDVNQHLMHPGSELSTRLTPFSQSDSSVSYQKGSITSIYQPQVPGQDHSPHSIYADMLGLLSPSADVPNEQWIRSWIPAT